MIPDLTTMIQAAGLAFAGFAAAVAALVLIARHPRGRRDKSATSTEIAFLFEGDTLLDASEAAYRLLDICAPQGTDLTRVLGFLTPMFPTLRAKLSGLGKDSKAWMTSTSGDACLQLVDGPRGLRIELSETGNGKSFLPLDRFSTAILKDELKMHRSIEASTPFPVWRQTEGGQILWANAEYRQLAERLSPSAQESSEFITVFDENFIATEKSHRVRRAQLDLPREAEPRWFEFQINRLGRDLLISAIPVDRVVRAERSLNDFVQTLTQTFAHLNVGLAVFSRSRELALFNPALSDLLGLSPEFLIARPTLFQLFDKLREKRMMPEPKDYKTWRRQMSALAAAAAGGLHSETWSLVDGRTYRVTGRPHPEGAIAFLFEDISAEITLERRFRSELQLGQSVIDGMAEAIAVFSPSGALILSNRTYAALWHERASLAPEEISLLDASHSWSRLCVPTPIWGDVRDFAATMGDRKNWTANVRMRDGRNLACRFDALPGGCTLVGFSEPSGAALAPIAVEGTSISA